jgi:hypothetical protein
MHCLEYDENAVKKSVLRHQRKSNVFMIRRFPRPGTILYSAFFKEAAAIIQALYQSVSNGRVHSDMAGSVLSLMMSDNVPDIVQMDACLKIQAVSNDYA